MKIVEFIDAFMRYDFLQKALLTSVMVGIICGVMGCFIILRGMALIGDAISHAVLPGVALSYMMGMNYFIGAVFTGIMTAIGIGFVSQNSRIKQDVAIGIIFTFVFAVGIILITFMRSSADLYHILFGNVLSVGSSDIWMILILGVVLIGLVFLFYKELLVSTFDPIMAQSYGLSNKWIHYSLMIFLTMVTVASLQTVGIVLVVAMLITPAATAYLLTNRLWVMIYLAAGIGAFSSVVGLYFSFSYNLASGATIVLVATFLFGAAFFFSPLQNLYWKAIKMKKDETKWLS